MEEEYYLPLAQAFSGSIATMISVREDDSVAFCDWASTLYQGVQRPLLPLP